MFEPCVSGEPGEHAIGTQPITGSRSCASPSSFPFLCIHRLAQWWRQVASQGRRGALCLWWRVVGCGWCGGVSGGGSSDGGDGGGGNSGGDGGGDGGGGDWCATRLHSKKSTFCRRQPRYVAARTSKAIIITACQSRLLPADGDLMARGSRTLWPVGLLWEHMQQVIIILYTIHRFLKIIINIL